MKDFEHNEYMIKSKKIEPAKITKEIASCTFTFEINNLDEVQSFVTSGCFQLADLAVKAIKNPGYYQIKLSLVEKE